MIFAVLGNLLTNIFAPAFARCQERAALGWLYAGIVGGVAGFSLLVLSGAAFLPNEFLFVLGNRYSHLQRELLLMVGGATLSMMASHPLDAERLAEPGSSAPGSIFRLRSGPSCCLFLSPISRA